VTAWVWPASQLVRVVDGDTFVASLTRDLGFHGRAVFEQKLRLARINAPAVNTDDGRKARAALVGLLTPEFEVTTTRAYKYGDEWMAEVVLPDGMNVSDQLVRVGLAVYWDGTGPRPGG
jgi:endonuclease YncB( thermonuclease family)